MRGQGVGGQDQPSTPPPPTWGSPGAHLSPMCFSGRCPRSPRRGTGCGVRGSAGLGSRFCSSAGCHRPSGGQSAVSGCCPCCPFIFFPPLAPLYPRPTSFSREARRQSASSCSLSLLSAMSARHQETFSLFSCESWSSALVLSSSLRRAACLSLQGGGDGVNRASPP